MKTWTTKNGYKVSVIFRGRCNVSLLTDGRKNILIDSSVEKQWDKLDKRLQKLNVKKVDYLILTHTHFDHAGNALNIKQKYNAQVIVHKNGISYLTTGSNIIPKGTNFFAGLIVDSLAGKLLPRIGSYNACNFDYSVEADMDLKEFGFNARLISTPGHTIDSMSLVVDNEIAIVGDAMFGIFPWSVMPPVGTDVKQMIKSWKVLLDTGCSVFIPGHGAPVKRNLVQNSYDKRNRNKNNIKPIPNTCISKI